MRSFRQTRYVLVWDEFPLTLSHSNLKLQAPSVSLLSGGTSASSDPTAPAGKGIAGNKTSTPLRIDVSGTSPSSQLALTPQSGQLEQPLTASGRPKRAHKPTQQFDFDKYYYSGSASSRGASSGGGGKQSVRAVSQAQASPKTATPTVGTGQSAGKKRHSVAGGPMPDVTETPTSVRSLHLFIPTHSFITINFRPQR